MGNRNNSWLIFAKHDGVRLPNSRAKHPLPGPVPQAIAEEMSKSVHFLPTKSGAIRDTLPTLKSELGGSGNRES